jgi:hypothetical protein
MELTLAASDPYSDSVFMITACRSTRPHSWRAFATARAPMSSTSEKMSVSIIMGLGSSVLETQLAVANDKTNKASRRIDVNDMMTWTLAYIRVVKVFACRCRRRFKMISNIPDAKRKDLPSCEELRVELDTCGISRNS